MTQIMREIVNVAVYVAVQAAAVVTVAKTSHLRRTGASRWIHRACACNTQTFLHRPCTLHQSHSLGTCCTRAPQKLFAELTRRMPGKAWTEIDNSGHAEAKAETTSGVGRNGRQVVFSRRYHVQSHPERASSLAQL